MPLGWLRIASLLATMRNRLDITFAVRQALATQGFYYEPAFSPTPAHVLELARALGPLYLPPDVDPDQPFIETRPAADASHFAPFDRAEGIGWHNDFSTHAKRPAISLAYVDRADPCDPENGAWRIASCDLVLDRLKAVPEGRDVVQFLLDTDLPYSFTREGDASFFRAVECRGPAPGRLGLRFYGRAIRDGARLAYGTIPAEIEHAVASVEVAADQVGHVLVAPAGAILAVDNWHSLHDRLPQSVDASLPLRRSLLCFVVEPHQVLPLPGSLPLISTGTWTEHDGVPPDLRQPR
jgi:hypothetical protein